METHDFKEHFSSLLTESEEHLSTLDQFLGTRGCCLLIAKVHPDVGTND